MKKIVWNVLTLALALVLCLGSFSVYAATVTFTAEDQVVKTLEAADGKVTLPEAPVTRSGQFVGWCGTLNGTSFILPAGAVLEGVTDNLTVSAATLHFSTNEGAEVRFNGNDLGVRFTTDISIADYDTLVTYAGSANVSLGTYIVPHYHLKKSNRNFDLEYLASKGYTKYLDVPAPLFYNTDTKTGMHTIAGSVEKILEKNRSLDFCGRGYMKLTYSNGETKLFYADFNYNKTIVSLYNAVFDAYNDRESSYPNLILNHGPYSTHSPYTVAQLDQMKALLDTVVAIDYRLTSPSFTYFTKKSLYYTSPWIITSEYYEVRNENTITVTPAPGASIESLKGVVLASRYRSMRSGGASFQNGTFRFVEDEYITITP